MSTMPKMLAVGLVLLLTLLTASALAASNTFIDHFDARLGSHLEDPDSAFTVTSGEIHRKIPTSGLDRRYVRTIPTSHDSGDWTYTITFDITNTSKPEIVFIGVGSGAAGGPYNEPIDSAEFRIHNQAIGGGMVHMAVSNANGLFCAPPPPGFATYIGSLPTDGRYKARLGKDGGLLHFSILDLTDTAIMSGAISVPSVISDPIARLFFGNAWPETMYDDMIVAPPPPTTKDECKKGGWETYAVFKNRGDCVSFVATGGKNLPAN